MSREALLTTLDNQFMSLAKAKGKGHGSYKARLSPALDKVLLMVGLHEPVNVKELANLLAITSAAATQHVAALAAAELISRQPSEHDRRAICLHLTPTGKNVLHDIHLTHCRFLEDLFRGLDDQELVTLTKLITKASNAYKKEKRV